MSDAHERTWQEGPQWPVFERVLRSAIASVDERALRLLSVGTGHESSAPPIELGGAEFNAVIVGSLGELSELVASQLQTGPTLVWPVWGRREPGHFDGETSRRDIHETLLDACTPRSPDDVLAVVIPTHSLSVHPSRRWREEFLGTWQPVEMIFARNLLAEIAPSFELAAVVMRPRSDTWIPLRMFRLPDNGPIDEVVADHERLLRQGGGSTEFGYVIRKSLDSGERLTYDSHDPEVDARRSHIRQFGPTIRLGELFQLVRRPAPGSRQFDAGSVRAITGRDISRSGEVLEPEGDEGLAEYPEDMHLQAGDLLVREIYRPDGHDGAVVAEVGAKDLPAVAGRGTIPLRPAEHLTRQEILFVMTLLRSPVTHTLLTAQGSSLGGVGRASPNALLDLEIPQPTQSLLTAVSDLHDARADFDQWSADASDVLSTMFEASDAAAAKSRLIATGRTLRLRAESARSMDDFPSVIRTRFPHPVAYRWRSAEAAVSHGATRDALDALVEAAEVLLAYAALVGLAEARHLGLEVRSSTEVRKKLASNRSGPSFGDWSNIVEELSNSKALADAPGAIMSFMRGFLVNDSAPHVARVRLAARRNDSAHLRYPAEGEIKAAVIEAEQDLLTLMRAAEFLSDIPLLHLTEVRWDSIQERSHVRYRSLMGDHSVVPARRRVFDIGGLEQDSLYLLDPDGQLRLARPFLIGRTCPTCGNWSTFHVDRAPADGVVLKSLERGHVLPDDDRAGAEGVGLL